MKFSNWRYVVLSAAVALAACKKDPDTHDHDHDHGDGAGCVDFTITHKVGARQLILDDSTYTNTTDTFNVSVFKYYLSNFQLKSMSTGNWESIDESYFLVDLSDASSTSFTLTGVPEGHYTELKFLIGVDSTRNVSGAQDGALDPAKGMFWSWNMGYIFLKIEGDANAAPSGYRYHIGGFSGTNNTIQEVSPSLGGTHIEVGSHNPEVHMIVDAGEIFVNPKTIAIGDSTAVTTPGSAAKEFSDNYADMITVDHIHNH